MAPPKGRAWRSLRKRRLAEVRFLLRRGWNREAHSVTLSSLIAAMRRTEGQSSGKSPKEAAGGAGCSSAPGAALHAGDESTNEGYASSSEWEKSASAAAQTPSSETLPVDAEEAPLPRYSPCFIHMRPVKHSRCNAEAALAEGKRAPRRSGPRSTPRSIPSSVPSSSVPSSSVPSSSVPSRRGDTSDYFIARRLRPSFRPPVIHLSDDSTATVHDE